MLEIIVEGTPRSLQGKGPGRADWMKLVTESARRQVPDGGRLDWIDVSVRLIHFCKSWGDLDGDLDNIAKPIIDAIAGVAIFNDNQVKEILLRRTETERNSITLIEGATAVLASRLEQLLSRDADPGFVYISVEAHVDHTRMK